MKKVLAITLSAIALSACQPQSVDNKEVEALRADVDEMKMDLYGDSRGTCEEAKVISSMDIYKDSLVGIPAADITGDDWHSANGGHGSRPHVRRRTSTAFPFFTHITLVAQTHINYVQRSGARLRHTGAHAQTTSSPCRLKVTFPRTRGARATRTEIGVTRSACRWHAPTGIGAGAASAPATLSIAAAVA